MQDRTNVIIIGCFGLFVLALFGGIVATCVVLKNARQSDMSDGDDPGSSDPQQPPSFTPPPNVPAYSDPSRRHKDFHPRDPTRVDLMDVAGPAEAFAREIQPGAQFVGIRASELKNGVANMNTLGDKNSVEFNFEFMGFDKSKPAGKDKIEGSISVYLKQSGLEARSSDFPAIHLEGNGSMGGALELPRCSSAKVFAEGVSSGVPENAVMQLFYERNLFADSGDPLQQHHHKAGKFDWSIRVDGHDEYRREIDGMNCSMVKNWGDKNPSAGHHHPKH